MKSREVLNKIITGKIYFEKELDIIEKDLEVLEIIKKHEPNLFRLRLCKNYTHFNNIYNDISALSKRILSEHEFNMLKEWLENDK